MMGMAVIAASEAYYYLEAYLITAVIYWVLCMALEKLFWKLEKHLTIFKVRETV